MSESKKIELWLNIVHYCFYVVNIKFQIFFNRFNPGLLIGRIPAVKRKFEEQGISQVEIVNKDWGDKRYGFGVMYSGGFLIAVVFVALWGVVSTSLGVLGIYLLVKPVYFITYCLIAYVICHLLVFRQDKYLKYFKKLDKKSRSDKWRFALFSLLFVVGSIALWLYSFQFIPQHLIR